MRNSSPFKPPEPIPATQESAAVYRIGKDSIKSEFCVRQSPPVPFTAAESSSYGGWNSINDHKLLAQRSIKTEAASMPLRLTACFKHNQ